MMTGHTYRPHTAAERDEEFSERATIREYLGGMTRAQAEAVTRVEVYGGQMALIEGAPVQQPRGAARSKRR